MEERARPRYDFFYQLLLTGTERRIMRNKPSSLAQPGSLTPSAHKWALYTRLNDDRFQPKADKCISKMRLTKKKLHRHS